MFNNTILAFTLLIFLSACASSKSTNTGGAVSPSSTTPVAQADTNKYKPDLSKLPAKSTHEILYDK